MPRKTGAIIPSPVNPSGTFRRVLCIPASPDWIALVTGALWQLTQAWYWDAESGDVEEAVTRAKQMYFEYQDQNGACDVPVAHVGDIKQSVNPVPADGWLLCDGTQYNRADYPDLAALIPVGTPNIGGDATVFFVPNMTGRVIVGAGDEAISPALQYAMGTLSGSPTHTLTESQIPSHTHEYASGAASGAVGNAPIYSTGVFLSPKLQTGATGGGNSHNNMQPFFAFYHHIYAGA